MSRPLTRLAGLVPGAFVSLALAGTAAETDLSFRVLLDGKPVGEHRFELRHDGDTREVLSQADIKVRVLFMDVYRYRHLATERWQGDCLVSMDARTDDNGRIETVDAHRLGDQFVVAATQGKGVHQGCVRSFAYWNPVILDGGRLLNAQTGEYLPVRVLPLGEARLTLNGKDESTHRYRLTGTGIDIDLWYTHDRQWVALESRIDDDHRLRYERN
jgi:hypothetical protein